MPKSMLIRRSRRHRNNTIINTVSFHSNTNKCLLLATNTTEQDKSFQFFKLRRTPTTK
jgi:hypothetical protein